MMNSDLTAVESTDLENPRAQRALTECMTVILEGACKHEFWPLVATGCRSLPVWIDRSAIDELLGAHVDDFPRLIASDSRTWIADTADSAGETANEHPNSCECSGHLNEALSCWYCYSAGYEDPNPTAEWKENPRRYHRLYDELGGQLCTGKSSTNMNTENLDFVDWRFEDAKTSKFTHGFHPYPAKFIPQIPATLMKYFSEEGDVVWDPFCGCGTAVVEAIRKGRHAVGTDLNPLATLMTRAKATPLEPESLSHDVRDHLDDVKRAHNFQEEYEVPDIPKLDGWFSDNAIRELSIIKGYITEIEDDNLQDFLKTGFSSIIVNVSYQDSNTRYTRVDNEMEPGETIRKYENKLNRMVRGMEDFYDDCNENHTPTVISQDLREDFTLNEEADLIITSPPYPNAYDYHLYHKYRMFWLDMKPRQMKHDEIGAHLVYQNRSKEKNMETFRENMTACLQNLEKNTKEGGRLCMVIGDSKLEGKIVRNNELMKELAKDTAFEVEKEFFRNIDSTKKTFNPENARAKKEAILVFQR